jgi:hypothetical protein
MLQAPAAIKPKLNLFKKAPSAFGYATYQHLIHTEWFVDEQPGVR